jgi:hypothetical protein
MRCMDFIWHIYWIRWNQQCSMAGTTWSTGGSSRVLGSFDYVLPRGKDSSIALPQLVYLIRE